MKGWVPAAIGAVALGLGSWWYIGSPWVTLYGMKSAIERRDAETLISYIDFEATRASMKDQLHAQLAATGPRTDANGWSLPDRTPRIEAIDRQIDAYITPEMLRAAIGPSNERPAAPVDSTAALIGGVALERSGLGTFVVRERGKRQGIGFVFAAHGLGWKLSGLDVPTGMAQGMMMRITGW